MERKRGDREGEKVRVFVLNSGGRKETPGEEAHSPWQHHEQRW